MKIIQFEPRYRDDLIFMILEAKNALGRVPGLNEDLLDIEKHYFAKGDRFWIAVDEHDRVIGSVGYNSIPDTSEIWLHRLFVKADRKHQGIGTKLLEVAETYAKEHGKTAVHVHLGTPKEQWQSAGSILESLECGRKGKCEMSFIVEQLSEEQREEFAKKTITNPLSCSLPILNPTSWVIDHQKDVYLFGIGTHRDYPDEALFFFHWKDLEFILPLRKQNQMPNTRIWSLNTTWKSPIVIMAFDRKQELLMDLKEALLIYKLDGTLTAYNQAVEVEFKF